VEKHKLSGAQPFPAALFFWPCFLAMIMVMRRVQERESAPGAVSRDGVRAGAAMPPCAASAGAWTILLKNYQPQALRDSNRLDITMKDVRDVAAAALGSEGPAGRGKRKIESF
jgi:hypothetical protein